MLYHCNANILIVAEFFALAFRSTLPLCVPLIYLIFIQNLSSAILKLKCSDNQTFHLNSFNDKSDLNWLVPFKVKNSYILTDNFMYLIMKYYSQPSGGFLQYKKHLFLLWESSIFWILSHTWIVNFEDCAHLFKISLKANNSEWLVFNVFFSLIP